MSHGIEAALLTVLVAPLLIALARRFGLVDRPGGRKRHLGEVPLVGGVAIYVSLGGMAIIHATSLDGEALRFTMLAGVTVVAGLIDDWRGLRPLSKLLLQFTIATLAVVWDGSLLGDLGNILGLGDIVLGWASPIVSILAYVVLMNAVNLMDGADGVAGGVTCVILCGLIALAALAGAPSLWVPTVALGAILGFLVYNMPLPRPRQGQPLAFLGEAGSMLIGFILAWSTFGVHRSAPQMPPIVFAWVLALPVLDMAAVAVSRIANGTSPFSPGRDHLHHLLLDRGVPGLGTAAAIGGLALLLGAAGIAGTLLGCADYLLFAALLVVSGAYGALTSRMRRSAALSHRVQRTPAATLPTHWHATDHVRGPKTETRRVRGARAA
jgi:UDP-GlcNAc:undecaprenyl-phosphate/decaprenyl-phosphate GlcNAc-1-phosphate transferase